MNLFFNPPKSFTFIVMQLHMTLSQ